MSNNYWLTIPTLTRSTSVVPVFGGGFGSVCPQHASVSPMPKRTADEAAAADKRWGSPWSPPLG